MGNKMLWTRTGETKSIGRNVHTLCICVCGKQSWVRNSHYGKESFGCRMCRVHEAKATHGETGTKLYRVYRGIMERCYDEKNKSFINYGARGIFVCNEWQKYEKFSVWAKVNGYKEGLTIDRINNDLGYSPANCRWVTAFEQALNKRNTLIVRELGIPLKTHCANAGLNYESERKKSWWR